MYTSSEAVEKLISRLSRLPGIGRKSAARLAFHILKLSPGEAGELADAIKEVKEKVGWCSICCNISETDPCPTCSDPRRRREIICVVEEAADAAAVDKAEGFNGLFHVLGGRLSPLDGIGPDDLRIKELLVRLTGVTEIIIATNPNVEGEATATYLSRLLKPMGIRVTRIARGLPVGADLEYADSATLARALEGRQEY
ncbi:recombination protein RecR [candidate division GN15 bacterium]|uniref:Recombination protein RecR n=1 Tax=candidate division GN15 bacterium TaxID=2072418 RepID=A0A855XAH2_9BACT|nr:MAG: recombination protein RecR [candidate division GN15 bacterium]